MSKYAQVIPSDKTLSDLQAEADNEAALRTAYLQKVKAEVTGDIGALLVAFPEVEVLTIVGYTPGFNDGDPCTHRQLDPYINGVDRYGEERERVSANLPEVSSETRRVVSRLVGSMKRRIADAFDTNFELTFTRTPSGITLREDEYDCGY